MRLADEAATLALGRSLSFLSLRGDVIALSGELGAGKTTLARGVLEGLGLRGEAASPTFPIVIEYQELALPIAHVDLYRIENPREIEELGLDDWLTQGALLIEWPERMGDRLWPHALRLTLARDASGGRALTAHVPAAWTRRWPPK